MRDSKLQEALEDVVEDLGGHPKSLDEIKDELEIRQACVNDLKQVRSGLTTHQGRLTILLSNLNTKLEDAESALSGEQKMCLKINSDLKSVIGHLKNAINESNLQDGNFMIEHILSPLFEENEKVRDHICNLVHKQFDEPLGNQIYLVTFMCLTVDTSFIFTKNQMFGDTANLCLCYFSVRDIKKTF